MTDPVSRDLAQPAGEEDFEFVQSQAHETDDLSSLTSTSGGTDIESDADHDDSQARSDVTLQMPSVDEVSAYMQQAARSMTRSEGEQACGSVRPSLDVQYDAPIVHDPLQFLDVQRGETIDLPIFYHGPERHKAIVLQKLAEGLLQHFSEDVWTSERYSIVVSKDNSTADLVPQSRMTLRVISTAEEVKLVHRPVVVICIVSGDGDSMPSEAADRLVEDLASSGVPLLPLLESSFPDGGTLDMLAEQLWIGTRRFLLSVRTAPYAAKAETVYRADGTSEHRLSTPSDRRPLSLEEFVGLEPEQVSKVLLPSIDAWNETRRRATWFSSSGKDTVYPALSQIVMWTLFLLSMAYSVHRTSTSSVEGLAHIGNWSSSTISFHQITETNTLIELPLQYRAQSASKVPEISAAVTRDGKVIPSRMQLVVDNLYSLDWAQSEAHGELVIAAEMTDSKVFLTEAYVVVYSTKTPFLHAVAERLRDLNHLGHLTPDVDVGRRVQELIKQVETSRSYVIGASKHQLKSFKEHGSQGLRKIQEDYSDVLLGTTDKLRQILSSTSTWTDKFNKVASGYGSETMTRASRGVQKIRDAIERQTLRSAKKNRPKSKRSGKK